MNDEINPNVNWIKLNRSLLQNEIWNLDPFSKGQAWVDLLLKARHKSDNVWFADDVVSIEKGGMVTTIRKLANDWKWSPGKVKKFLENLQKEEMIFLKIEQKRTIINIVNYCDYQDVRINDRTINEQSMNNDESINELNKEYKNIKKEKKEKNSNIYAPLCTEIISYLNEKAGTNFRTSAESNKRHIVARLNERYTVDDFKLVIDCKCSEWRDNDKMKKYLCPETLFGSKFEKYLNQAKQSNSDDDDIKRWLSE